VVGQLRHEGLTATPDSAIRWLRNAGDRRLGPIVVQVDRDAARRDLAPAWVDDESLVFASSREGVVNVYSKRADGSGVAQPLTNNENVE